MSKTRKPFVDFRAIRGQITMEQVLEHYEVLHTLKRTGNRLSGPCPIHKGTNPSQFRVDAEKNVWNCFSECKHGGNTLDFIARMENCSVHDAALKACEWFGIPIAEVKSGGAKEESHEPEEKPERPARAPAKPASKPVVAPKAEDSTANAPLKFRLDNLHHETPYLTEQRGLTLDTITEFGLGFFKGDKGLMVGRVVIPIHNAKGELVAYAGRWPGEPPDKDTEKYKLPPRFNKLLEVFNLHRAAGEPADKPLVVVEGYFGAIKLHQYGCRKVVALMGWFMSPAQEQLIREHVKASRIVVMLDENKAGQEAREGIAGRLAKFAYVRIHVFDKPDMRPDQLSVEDVRAILEGPP